MNGSGGEICLDVGFKCIELFLQDGKKYVVCTVIGAKIPACFAGEATF